MIIKGSARAAPGELAHHLMRCDTNEAVRVMELRGVASLDVAGALAELDGMGAGSRSHRTLYHASINTPVVEQLTPEQQGIARDLLAEKMGLANQPFIVVQHVKAGRQHTHIVWSRIDVETGRAIPDSHNYRKHEEVSRELERQFDHSPVLGAHVRDKENEPRPQRGPTWGEQRQAERSGLTPAAAKAIVTEMWRQTATGQDFRHRVEAEGFILARGDRRDFVLVDKAGEIHGLTRRIEGARAKDVRDRMADIDAAELPDAMEARRRIRDQLEQAKELGFTTTADRLRADELEARGSAGRPRLSNAHQEVSDALWQLNKTMRGQMEATIPGRATEQAQRTEPPPRETLGAKLQREALERGDKKEQPAPPRPLSQLRDELGRPRRSRRIEDDLLH